MGNYTKDGKENLRRDCMTGSCETHSAPFEGYNVHAGYAVADASITRKAKHVDRKRREDCTMAVGCKRKASFGQRSSFESSM